MNYQISIIGIGIIAIYSFLVLLIVAWPLKKLFGTFRWKWVVIAPPVLVLLALPWAEEYWIARNFHAACKDAGVHVVRKVEVEGFYDATRSTPHGVVFPLHAQELEKSGFSFTELESSDEKGRIVRVERNGGEWKKVVLDRPTARYHYKYAYQPTPYKTEEIIGWKLIKSGTLIIDSETGEVIGRNTTYTRLPNIADWQLIRFFGSGGYSCPHPEKGPFQPSFPQAVLIPTTKR